MTISRVLNKLHPASWLLLFSVVVSAVSAINPNGYDVWFFELMLGVPIVLFLWCTRNRFQFSNFVYGWVGVHFVVLAIGAHYTYAEEPFFNWLKEVLGLERNYYDRVGHFFQGFVPFLIVREVVLRTTTINNGKMLNFLSAMTVTGFSAIYELIEMLTVKIFYPTEGIMWLGMQGDVWDAQNDMLQCLSGALLAWLLLSRWHNKSMERLLGRRTHRKA
jgi:putative membrane protein